jgi:uncharacterized protein (TIGR02145 family)
MMVYNLTISPDNHLNEGVYYNNGEKWHPVISDENMNTVIIFLRQPGFIWLGDDGNLTDTLSFELAAVDKTGFTYQWYRRDPETLLSTPVTGATSDKIIINPAGSPNKANYGITEKGKVYQFYCVVVNGSQYGISGTGRVVFGPGARLANGGWINVANANLGADQNKSLAEQLAYTPTAAASGVNDKDCDPAVYGDWYQWGRKKDGHENRTVLAANTSLNYLNAVNGVKVDSLDTSSGQIKSNLSNISGKFIQRNDGTGDWRQYPANAPTNTDIAPADAWTWNNANNDPCKDLGAKWRVPTQAEWAQIHTSNTWVWRDGAGSTTSGYEIKPGGAGKPSSLFLPATGARSRGNGAPYSVGASGHYWSSIVTGTGSYSLNFTSGSIAPASTSARSTGLPVRCVSESSD